MWGNQGTLQPAKCLARYVGLHYIIKKLPSPVFSSGACKLHTDPLVYLAAYLTDIPSYTSYTSSRHIYVLIRCFESRATELV